MKQAVDGTPLGQDEKDKLWRYLEGAANHLVNQMD
jgi:hemoglobin